MPTVHRTGPYRFYFYSGDRDEPPHVHVSREANEAKYWLDPTRLAFSRGFSSVELGRIEGIVGDHAMDFMEAWNAFFSD
jgi:hypothetical protein